MTRTTTIAWGAALAALTLLAASAHARTKIGASISVAIDTGRHANHSGTVETVFAEDVTVPDAAWVQLHFENVALAGQDSITVTSTTDGQTQRIDAGRVHEGSVDSAYFVGPTVAVALQVGAGATASGFRITEIAHGPAPVAEPRTICGPDDDRDFSTDARVCSLVIKDVAGDAFQGTAFLANDDPSCMLSAGHNFFVRPGKPKTSSVVVHCNVYGPGVVPIAAVVDQYPVSVPRVRGHYQPLDGADPGRTDDHAAFIPRPSLGNGMTIFANQGAFYAPDDTDPAFLDLVTVTGHGADTDQPARDYFQQSETGFFFDRTGIVVQHVVDTEGGNSGSPVIFDGDAYGIHVRGGCDADLNDLNEATWVGHDDVEIDLTLLCDPPLDHYLCYTAKDRRRQYDPQGTIVDDPPEVLNLKDRFDALDKAYRPTKARMFCTPVDKNAEGVLDEDTHQKVYRIRKLVGEHLQPTVEVRNQFGTFTLHLVKEVELMVPTSKDPTAFPPPAVPPTVTPPDPSQPGFEHFKCYRVTLRGERFPRGILAELDDQFGFQKVKVKKPRRFCTPVAKNGEPIRDPDRNLVCHGVRPLVKKALSKNAHAVANQFGVEFLQLRKEKQLCVPSIITAGGITLP